MDNRELTPLEKIDTCGTLLDKLVDAQGRAKCGYIYIINEFLNDIKNHVLILEEQVRDAKFKKETVLVENNLDETISQE